MEKEKELTIFKAAMDQVQDIVFMVVPETMKIFYANMFAEKLSGYSVEKLMGMNINNLFELPTDKETFLKYQGKEKILAKISDGERNLVCKDGSLISVEIKVDLFNTTDEDQYLILMARDISRRKELEVEREKLNTELLEAHKLEAVGQLAAGIAHEINTPTQYVGTNLDFFNDAFSDILELISKYQDIVSLAQKEKSIPSEAIEELEEILENADWEYLQREIPEAIRQSKEGIKRVTSIVRAMKDFSHPGSGVKEPNDLNKIVETTVTISRNEWKYVSDIELELDPNLPPVPCLPDHIGQALLNLIVNAAHAIAEKHGDNPENKTDIITIKTSKQYSTAQIIVQDTGKGMSEDIKKHIFEPFFTTKEVGKGTGQGLPIVRDVIVGKHNGTIDVKSEMDVGTRFIITLPLHK